MVKKLLSMSALFLLAGAALFAQAAELKIDYQYNLAVPADAGNYFSFTGPIRYMLADKDKLDATTGASAKNSTELFSAYQFDVTGKPVIAGGLRSLFLFPVGPDATRVSDKLTVTKAANGVITVNYAHRGTAYQLTTDASGMLDVATGVKKRAIGYIQGSNPQVISRDFSSDGTAAGIDWAKVWNTSIAGGKEITAGVANKTGAVGPDAADAAAMYSWDGKLQFTFANNILKIAGTLSVKR